MKTVILIRFGTPQVLPKELMLFNEFRRESSVGIAGSIDKVGVIAAFKTELSPNEIAAQYEALADATDDCLPVIAAYLENVSLNFKYFGFDDFIREFKQKCIEAGLEESSAPSSEEPIQVCNLSLDELLDLVSSKGITNLTPEESARLKELSK